MGLCVDEAEISEQQKGGLQVNWLPAQVGGAGGTGGGSPSSHTGVCPVRADLQVAPMPCRSGLSPAGTRLGGWEFGLLRARPQTRMALRV